MSPSARRLPVLPKATQDPAPDYHYTRSQSQPVPCKTFGKTFILLCNSPLKIPLPPSALRRLDQETEHRFHGDFASDTENRSQLLPSGALCLRLFVHRTVRRVGLFCKARLSVLLLLFLLLYIIVTKNNKRLCVDYTGIGTMPD